MATTTFTAGTVVASAWLNDANTATYESFINVKQAPYNAVGDGSTDDTTAIAAALTAASTLKLPVLIVGGTYKFTSTLTVPQGVRVIGAGHSSEIGVSGLTLLQKTFNGTGVILSVDAVLEHLQVDGNGYTGDNIQMKSERSVLKFVSSTRAGQDGIRVGDDGAVANTNLCRIEHCIALSNTRHGLHFNDPTGATDAGGITVVGGDYRSNGGDGIKLDNCTWNTFIGPVVQNNTGVGIRITSNARSMSIFGGDIEGNTTYQGVIESGSFGHTIIGPFYSTVPGWVDLSGYRERNLIQQYRFSISVMSNGTNLIATDSTAGATPRMSLYGDTGLNEMVRISGATTGTSGSSATLYTKPDGGTPGAAISFDMLQRTTPQKAFIEQLSAITYATTMTPTAGTANLFQINVSDGVAFTIAAPTNPSLGQFISFCIRNTSGGAMGTITWNSVFKLAGWTNPDTGFSRTIGFRYDGANWVMHYVTASQVPN